jgi:hypothetical protein
VLKAVPLFTQRGAPSGTLIHDGLENFWSTRDTKGTETTEENGSGATQHHAPTLYGNLFKSAESVDHSLCLSFVSFVDKSRDSYARICLTTSPYTSVSR